MEVNNNNTKSNNRVDTLDLYNITIEECHFKWFNQQNIGSISPEDVLTRVDSWINDIEYLNTGQHCTNVSIHLIKALSSIHCNRVKDALLAIDNALTYLDDHKNDASLSKEHFKTYMDLAIANWYEIEKHTKVMLSSTAPDAEINMIKCKQLEAPDEEDLDSNKCKAAFLAAKAIFYGHVWRKPEKLEILEQVVKLEPECWEFWDYLSRSIRSSARDNNIYAMPGDKEVNAVHRAFCLNPSSSITLQRFSLLHEDTLKATSTRTHVPGTMKMHENLVMCFKNQEEIVDQMKNSIKKAVSLSPESYKINLKLAEVLRVVAKYTGESHQDAEDEFQRCLQKWPTNSEVLHKAGVFYYYSKNLPDFGLELFSRSLESNPSNFPCLIDKLKLYMAFRSLDMAQVCVTDFLHRVTFPPSQEARLLRFKGVIDWILGNQSQAINSVYKSFQADPKSVCVDVWYELQNYYGVRHFNSRYGTELKAFFKKIIQSNKCEKLEASFKEYSNHTGIVIDFKEKTSRRSDCRKLFDGEKCPW